MLKSIKKTLLGAALIAAVSAPHAFAETTLNGRRGAIPAAAILGAVQWAHDGRDHFAGCANFAFVLMC